MIRVMLYDRFDQPLGELAEGEVFGLVRTERINGEHSLKITTTRVLEKGQRILTCDARGKWREHVVYGTDALHDSGEKPFGEYYCVWSVQHDLVGTRISSMPGVQTPVAASVALAAALAGTARWANGTVTNTNMGGASMYDTDGWSGLSTLVNVWGGEIDTTIEVGSMGVTARKVDLYAMQGDQDAKRRFDFGADIKSVRRRMDDGAIYCRITPRGKGEETDSGGYGRKITIESVNDGKDYLENEDMVDLAKLPDGNGGWEYPTLEVENSGCTTPQELLDWARSVLEYYTVPKITYTVDVLQLAQEGVDMHGVSLGDTVHIVDRKFGSGLRTSGRVMQTVVNMLDEADMQVTVGSIGGDIADIIASMETRLSSVTDVLGSVGMGTDDYYSVMLAHLNEQINATGGYTYITEGQGVRTYDAAVTDPLVGAEASAVVEVKGGTIRIANSKTAQGAWKWKTVFTSGLVASEVLSASRITTGALRVEDANHNAVMVADIDSGTFEVNTSNFSVTTAGVITAIAGTLGGFNINATKIFNDALELNGDGLYFLRNDRVVAAIDPVLATSNIDASELNFLVPKKFSFLAKAPSSTGSSKRPMYYELDSNYGNGTGKMEFNCDVDFDLVPTITGAITGAVNIPKLNGSGYYCTLTFTNGILTNITYL